MHHCSDQCESAASDILHSAVHAMEFIVVCTLQCSVVQCSVVQFAECSANSMRQEGPILHCGALYTVVHGAGGTNIGEFITMISLSHTIMTPPLSSSLFQYRALIEKITEEYSWNILEI